jgi:hypothetical protein
MYKTTLIDYLPQFVKALTEQLQSDEKRWGDTWKKRPVLGQQKRFFDKIKDYQDQFENGGTPVPWLKIAGECLIGWVRQNMSDPA